MHLRKTRARVRQFFTRTQLQFFSACAQRLRPLFAAPRDVFIKKKPILAPRCARAPRRALFALLTT
ncbi:hypothetical protein Hanom_Chr08g00719501 [Helianthus anomalus]